MTSPKLPAGRLPSATSDGEHLVQDAVVLDFPLFNKFSINYPSGETGRPIPTPPSSDRPALSSSDSGETDTSADEESGHELETDNFDSNHSPTIPRLRPALQGPGGSSPPHLPRFSRAFSAPLPSQLGHLQHPHKPPSFPRMTLKSSLSDPASKSEISQWKELSLELADSVQMVIQTMLQVSPSQVLEPAKEQFSACALAVPTPSMSAMFTAMKNLNYISANMNTFCSGESEHEGEGGLPLFSSKKHNDFDVGELLQSTGDALSGTAAHTGVDLVLYHGDVGLKHVWAKGDESGLSYLLSHIVRQILSIAHRADTLELGLHVRPQSSKRQEPSVGLETEDPEDPFKDASDGPLQCVVEIFHRFGATESSSNVDTRPQPDLTTLLLRRLSQKVGATLTQHPPTNDSGRSYRVSFALDAGTPPIETPATVTASNGGPSNEPSLEQLTSFMESLKGKKVNLYASSKGSFAHHLTSYLTAWGMDVSHITAEVGVESPLDVNSSSPNPSLPSDGYTPSGIPPKAEPRQPQAQPPSFVFIDDDVAVLKERLQALRPETTHPMNLNLRKRPSLAPHHRPRSSPQVARLATTSAVSSTPAVILHFTSLSNFKLAKDVVQSTLAAYQGTPFPIPEVMIIPKPAGPRRFLTALHSAVTKPVVDPFFSPIATTPGTPGLLNGGGSFFQSFNSSNISPKSSAMMHRPTGSRSNSDRSAKSVNIEGATHGHPSSPLAIPDPVEYFSDAAMKLGTSPSSGLVIQSPDGQPAGIFFHPKARGTSRQPSATFMERGQGHLNVTNANHRKSISDEPSPISFSSLHEQQGSTAGPSNLVRRGSGPRSKPNSPRVRPASPHIPIENASLSPATETQAHSPTQAQRRGSSDLAGPQRKMSGSVNGSRPNSPANEPPTRKSSTPARRDSNSGTLAPASTSAATKKAKSPADSNIVPPISVLIVDDNPINRTILSTFMKKKKIKFDVASNGKEAVEKWRTGEFHLILMDIQMPVMDGIAATSEIRKIEKLNACAGFPPGTPGTDAEPPTPSDTSSVGTRSTASPYRSSVIIVALTASSLQSDRIAALAAGCNDFLTKPVSLQWLNNKLIEWGSIKALQMWADLAPGVGMPEARNVAERLHVPRDRGVGAAAAAVVASTSVVLTPEGQTPVLSVSPVKPVPLKRQLSGSSMLAAEPTPIVANGGELQLGGITEKDRLAKRASAGVVVEPLTPSSSNSSGDNMTRNLLSVAGSTTVPTRESESQEDAEDPQTKASSPEQSPDTVSEGTSATGGDGYDGR
ncbi:Two-component response regulator SSK1p [Marasmius sp. AFHP31]|nr:Two-component response regulator SSK1p [Marasmius sp. AFHP31]